MASSLAEREAQSREKPVLTLPKKPALSFANGPVLAPTSLPLRPADAAPRASSLAETARLLPLYWHLLSLDAPSVAVLWAWSFARALHINLSASPLLLLFTGTWLLYVGDRILDGLRVKSGPAADRLRERHYFYMRYRAAALLAAIPTAALLGWLVFARMRPAARHADVLIFTIATVYFSIVHLRGPATQRWFPKELIVALVFAAGTSVPVWTRLVPANSAVTLGLLAALFAALCWLNCVAIEKWEQRPRRTPIRAQDATTQINESIADPIARWGQRRLRTLCTAVAAMGLLVAVLFLRSGQLPAAALCFVATLSAGLLHTLDRTPLPAIHLRIAADAALLTPLLLVFIR